MVGGKSKGTAVTVGSGVNLSQLYNATGNMGKIFVGGTAATVVAAGGYVQGGGHSALSPLYGLASDNCLGKVVICLCIFRPISGLTQISGFNVVVANGSLVTANEAVNPDRKSLINQSSGCLATILLSSSILGSPGWRCWFMGRYCQCHIPDVPDV
jgi:hypothetical protein